MLARPACLLPAGKFPLQHSPRNLCQPAASRQLESRPFTHPSRKPSESGNTDGPPPAGEPDGRPLVFRTRFQELRFFTVVHRLQRPENWLVFSQLRELISDWRVQSIRLCASCTPTTRQLRGDFMPGSCPSPWGEQSSACRTPSAREGLLTLTQIHKDRHKSKFCRLLVPPDMFKVAGTGQDFL